jgi:hypothetical protein
MEDAPTFTRSALWVSLLFLYAYGDIFGFFKPGQIEDVIEGEISGIEITEGFLFRDLGLHRDRERHGLPDPGPQAGGSPLVKRHSGGPVHCLDPRSRDRGVGVLLVPERRRDRIAVADRAVCLDVATRASRHGLGRRGAAEHRFQARRNAPDSQAPTKNGSSPPRPKDQNESRSPSR